MLFLLPRKDDGNGGFLGGGDWSETGQNHVGKLLLHRQAADLRLRHLANSAGLQVVVSSAWLRLALTGGGLELRLSLELGSGHRFLHEKLAKS